MLRIEGTRKDTRVPLWPSLLEDWSPEACGLARLVWRCQR